MAPPSKEPSQEPGGSGVGRDVLDNEENVFIVQLESIKTSFIAGVRCFSKTLVSSSRVKNLAPIESLAIDHFNRSGRSYHKQVQRPIAGLQQTN